MQAKPATPTFTNSHQKPTLIRGQTQAKSATLIIIFTNSHQKQDSGKACNPCGPCLNSFLLLFGGGVISRVGHGHIYYTVHMRYIWQENHETTYGHVTVYMYGPVQP
jgi:hypothetical protein